jgi:hypothetical protein
MNTAAIIKIHWLDMLQHSRSIMVFFTEKKLN